MRGCSFVRCSVALLLGCNAIAGIDPPVDRAPSHDASPAIDSNVQPDSESRLDASPAGDATGDDGTGNDASSSEARAEGGSDASPETGGRVDRWVPIPTTSDSPGDRLNHSAIWTGKEMIVWGGRYVMTSDMQTGGRYDPVTQTWTPTSLVQAPPARSGHSAVWTGAEMIVWGGEPAEGGRYDPAFDRWRPMMTSRAGGGRTGHAAAWTGTEMLVWCGVAPGKPLGERYSPTRDEWTDMSSTGAPPCTSGGSTSVWTGTKLIVWGGNVGDAPTNVGGVYDPATDTWHLIPTTGAPAPRTSHSAVWTGSVMMIWGGETGDGQTVHVFADGGAYDPALDRWEPIAGALGTTRHVATWSPPVADRPGLMLVWGGSIESADAGIHLLGEGHVYDPLARAWYPMSMTGEPWPRTDPTAVWTGSEMIVWGGFRSLANNGSTGRDGGRYTP